MIADPQSVIWTPSMWLPAILSDKPSMRLVDRVHLAHILIGAMAIFAYGRLRGWRDEASLIAAVSFMMNGALTVRLEHLLMTVSTMWIAVTLWRLEAAIQFGGFWRGLMFGAPLGLLLIDRNHVAYLGALFLFLYWLSRLDFSAPYAFRRHGSVVVGGVFALLLAAVPLLLLFQLIGQSNRPSFGYTEASWQSLPPPQISSFLFPEYFGSFKKFGTHWGPASKAWGDFTLNIHRGMIYLYCGTLASLLILWIGVARRQLFAPGMRFFSIMAIVSLIYALGRYTPVFKVLYDWVPGVDLFRRPSDALFIFGIIISLIVGALLHRALTMPNTRPEKGSAILALCVMVAAIIPLILISASFDRLDELIEDIAVFLILGVGFAALIVWARRSDRWRPAALLLLFFGVSADLSYYNSKTILSAWRPPHYQPMETPENDPFFSKLPALLAEADPSGAPWRVYIRHGNWFVLFATEGDHAFKQQERNQIRDCRRHPIRFEGYSISYRRSPITPKGGGEPKWHAWVRIDGPTYKQPKSNFLDRATHRNAKSLAQDFARVPYARYAPVQRQLLNIIRAVNKAR